MADKDFEVLLFKVSERYVKLEKAIRGVIDRVVSPVCSSCTKICCKASYCRRTLRNPWYLFLIERYGDGTEIEWERSYPPPGLGPNGCMIRAGRYAYCYAYNCRVILKSLGSEEARRYFKEISDLLKNAGLNFAGHKHLTDVRDWREITLPRLEMLDEKIEEGTKRFLKLCSLLFIGEPGELPGLFDLKETLG